MTKKRFSTSQAWNIEEPLINLTPLIDVVFVILIMFIVIAPLLELDRIELAHGQTSSGSQTAAQESSPISLHVFKDNTIHLNHQPIKLDQLTSSLKAAKERYPQAQPQVFHDKNAHFGTYQAIKNASEAAGFAQLDIVLEP